jgi:hypothetical protein
MRYSEIFVVIYFNKETFLFKILSGFVFSVTGLRIVRVFGESTVLLVGGWLLKQLSVLVSFVELLGSPPTKCW